MSDPDLDRDHIERLRIENIRLLKHNDMLLMTALSFLIRGLKNDETDEVIETLELMVDYYKNRIAKD